jgi:hypothetical protein
MKNILFIILLIPSVLYAAPSKPIVVVNEDTLTISGSSFGTKSTAAPLLFDNFEGGTVGQSIDTGGYWTTSWDAEGYEPLYNSDNARTGSTKHSYHLMDVGGGSEIISPSLGTLSDKIYVDFWYRVNKNGNPSNCQIKVWRLFGADASDLYPSFAYYDNSGKLVQFDSSLGSDCETAHLLDSDYFGDTYNSWNHFQVQVSVGTVGESDGGYTYWVNNGSPDEDRYDLAVYPNESCQFHKVRFGEWLANKNCTENGANTRFDDIYVDDSWSRILVGDNSTFNSCTHTEVQIPTAWSASQITVTINQGSFGDDDTVYLFVFDSDGNISPASDGFTFSDLVTETSTGIGISGQGFSLQ